MTLLVRVLNHPWFFWLLLCLPSVPMVAGLVSGSSTPERLLHPTGEFAARFMIVAMMVTPLAMLFRRAGWTRWLMARRRALGVAAFGYAAAHTVLYVIDMETLRAMLAEFFALGIWTGWAAFVIFLPLALTSNDLSARLMKRGWQWLHRWVYLAAVFTLLHWIFVHNALGPALVHFIPLALLETWRVSVLLRRRQARKGRAVAAAPDSA